MLPITGEYPVFWGSLLHMGQSSTAAEAEPEPKRRADMMIKGRQLLFMCIGIF